MKNILLTTTALATLFAGVAAAGGRVEDDLTVTMGGQLQAQAGFRSQKSDYTKATSQALGGTGTTVFERGVTPGNKSVAFDTVSAVHATVRGKSEAGTVYGAQIGIQTTNRSTLPAGQNALDRTFLFVENDMGRVEVGSNSGVGSTMRIGAESIANGTGGIDGQGLNYVNLNTFQSSAYTANAVQSSNFVTSPTLFLTNFQSSGAPSNAFIEGDEKSRKITYYTPEFNGLQAGISYTPDTRNSGQDYIDQLGQASTGATVGYNYGQYIQPTAKDAVTGGISWTGKFDRDQEFKVSVVGETASVKKSANETLNNYKNVASAVVGAQYTYQNFALAGSWGTQGKSMYADLASTQVAMKEASFYTLGAAYVQGPVGASLTWMNSTKNKNTMNIVSLGLDYEVAPGLLPFAEATYFNMEQKNTYANGVSVANTGAVTYTAATNTAVATPYKNSGTAFILGTKINF